MQDETHNSKSWDFPGVPVVKTSTVGDMGSIPGRGTKIPQAMWQKTKK